MISPINPSAANCFSSKLRNSVRELTKMGPISFTSSTPHPPILTHLLSDVDILVGANAIVAEAKFERAREDLERYLILFLRRRRTPRTRWRRVGDLLKRRVQLVIGARLGRFSKSHWVVSDKVKLTLESVTPVSSDSGSTPRGLGRPCWQVSVTL